MTTTTTEAAAADTATTPGSAEAAAETAEQAPKSQDELWLDAAREFVLTVDGHRVHITRYDNHGRLLADGAWAAMFPLGPLNPHYAVHHEGKWQIRYKFYTPLSTRQAAYTAARRAVREMVATGDWPDRTTPAPTSAES